MKTFAAFSITAIGVVVPVMIATRAFAGDAFSPESLLAGSRWMAAGSISRVEDVPLERMVVIQICAIADMAFTMVGTRLTKFDRAGLSGRSVPVGYTRVESAPSSDGATLMTLHTAADAGDMPESYLIESGGAFMRVQMNGANGEAFLKCTMGTPPAIPATTPIPQASTAPGNANPNP